MGLVVSGVWLHFIQPDQNAMLIVLRGLVTQASGIWRVRHALNWRTILPYIIGGFFGVPIGTVLLKAVDSTSIRFEIGVMLVMFGLYGLLRPAFKPIQGAFRPHYASGS